MSPENGRWASSAEERVRRDVVLFIVVAVVTLAAVSVGAVLGARQVARGDALADAERTTQRLADLVVGPLLIDVLAGDRARRAELDQAVVNRLRDGMFSELTVWQADGRIVYASDTTQIGAIEPVPAEVTAAIERGETSSGLEEQPEAGAVPGEQGFVEVYVPLRLPGRTPLAFEIYYSADKLNRQAAALAARVVPLALGALVLLQVVQIPIAVSLARRVRRHENHRWHLLESALSASERERRQIAADLHDGVVQDLAGAGYALGALRRDLPEHRHGALDAVSTAVRGSVDQLRRLMVDIYPPDLSGGGLAGAIGDLTGRLRERGVAVTLQIQPLPPVDAETAAALYRVARETLSNVAQHARAGAVTVHLGPDPEDPQHVLFTVDDDGVGIAPERLDRRAEGHLGLRLLIDRVDALGGRFTVEPRSEGGTRACARVPARTAG
ncbi:sensor histidine kinase [Pseudonocardia acidicola]|uniref:Histidine kinase domain-containing protein n=1 Tax=Pseudonocardia acidicola TaxID=2724939 RepID=A0ABX1S4H8_9PSEU|nr:ATP-binding protein [Pseudonocardia acidicola]NMH96475.1 hypothetical protein [Pseudonocardia acidicola]